MSRSQIRARRSQLVSTYGVGGLFPSETSSYMIVGLDHWNADRAVEVSEPRLARSLGVQQLKSPPAGTSKDVPVVRFPRTQICPSCRRIGTTHQLAGDWNSSYCSCKAGRTKEAPLSPFRLITACRRGHIDEFPFFQWLHRGQEYSAAEHQLTMKTLGRTSSLDDLVLECTCGVHPRSLDGASSGFALREIKNCQGFRPWLGPEHTETCSEPLQVVQRGASNVWFPTVRSALSIPPYSLALAKFVDKYWKSLKNPEAVTEVLLETLAEGTRFSADDLRKEIERRRSDETGEALDEGQLRRQEYAALMDGRAENEGESDFVCEVVTLTDELQGETAGLMKELRKVTRLREVRALYGFTRLNADAEAVSPLSAEPTGWLPAIEVIGEGVFVGLDRSRLEAWASGAFADRRRKLLQDAADKQSAMFNRGKIEVDIVRVALHTLAHVLIDQLSLDAGYPASSLRERLFVDDGIAGILIYTASSDSAGSLGGVASQADPELFSAALQEGLLRLSWCSSDPVCIESTASGADALNLAACHACVLVPETSCELNNTYLDRALLFGTHEEGEQGAGLFHQLVTL